MNFSRTLRTTMVAWLFSIFALVSFALAAVNLNTASETELENLPGVGKKQASEIMAKRPFKSVDDLKNVKGIGDKKFAKLAPLVTVDAAGATAAVANNAATTTSNAATTTSTAANNAATTAAGGATAAANRMGNAATTAGNRVEESAQSAESHARSAKKEAMTAGERVNINTASKEQLERLPGIGEAKAQAIIGARPFNAPEDIMKVKGIKQGIFNKIKDHITTSG